MSQIEQLEQAVKALPKGEFDEFKRWLKDYDVPDGNRQAPFGRKAETISKLRSLSRDCAKEGWDGNGASAIDPAALLNAEAFVSALPAEISQPHIAPEPDGEFSLDWARSSTRMFSLSCGSDNRLAYGWRDDSNSGHGVELFDGASISQRLLALIKSIDN